MPAALAPALAVGDSRREVRRANLRRLLAPRQIAVVGGREAAMAIRQCRGLGYAGEIWPVNPNRAELEGLSCYASVEALPGAPDAAFVAVPRRATIQVVRALAARGAGGCVCYAAGFAELGGEGAELQAQLAAAAGDIALVGPNCYGLLNYLDRVALWPDQHGGGPVERGVAVVTQSGNIGLNLTMQERSLPLAAVVSLGNQAVLGFADYIAALADDPRIAAIGLYVEGLGDVPAFAEAAARALAKGVPLVALKGGESELGARVALSHTASLAGGTRIYEALFERLGIVSVDTLEALLETLKLFAVGEPPPGRRLAVLCCSGGEAALVADLAARQGLELPALSAGQAAALAPQLSDFASLGNPVDYNTGVWGDPPALERCFTTVMAGEIDGALLVIDVPRATLPGLEAWDAAIDGFIAAQRATGMPAAVVSTLPELLPAAFRDRLVARGIAPFQGLEAAIVALAGGARYAEARRRAALQQDPAPGRLVAAPSAASGGRSLDEWQSKQRLARLGLRVPDGRLAAAAEAPAAAAALGFPVAVKALGLAHKSELGAVALGLTSRAAVARTVRAMGRALSGVAGFEGRFLVERMISGAVAELIVGITAVPGFGLALVVGSGGVLVELVDDARTLLLPTDRETVAAALASLKAARLLDGYRGAPAGDREAAVDAILAVAAFAEAEAERLLELDINPLLVLPRGGGVVVADALLRTSEP